MAAQRTLGINGLGRIGKLTLWHHLGRDDFDRFVVNTGRPVGTSLDAVVQYISKDTTYGPLHRFLFGRSGGRDMSVVDEERGLITAYGKEIVILREARNPRDIPWREHGVALVVECTGTFRDPHAEADAPRGSLRGHLAAGASVVVQSSPFKSGQKGAPFPDDTAMFIHGINDYEFDPAVHKVVSAASCTTTALAHMMRPLLDRDLTKDMITAGMSTVHAVTNSQPVLDAVPKAGATDLRKSRGAHRQRGDHLDERRRRAGARHARDRQHRLHGRLGAHPHLERQPHHPQRDLPERGAHRRHRVGGARRHQRHLPGGRRRRGQGAAQVHARSRTSPPTCSARTRPWSSRAWRRTRAPGS